MTSEFTAGGTQNTRPQDIQGEADDAGCDACAMHQAQSADWQWCQPAANYAAWPWQRCKAMLVRNCVGECLHCRAQLQESG